MAFALISYDDLANVTPRSYEYTRTFFSTTAITGAVHPRYTWYLVLLAPVWCMYARRLTHLSPVDWHLTVYFL